ncbi:hypothetical protein OG738_06630 [Amycolatopsis sp. NBC_01488]|uniref:hypothetical protein n=1 Tax=Amycolatopsis sp. NBC_01488 TaxID=2903563 RepID=UPI002E29557A|nr:hypothetical protein [Amycolatopsis sp. NBC_01488]
MKKTWLRAGAIATAAIAVTALGVPADAAAIRIAWQPTVLPLPPGAGAGTLTGSDGKGEYTGTFPVNGVTQVVSWRNGQPIVRGVPSGYDRVEANDENSSGVVAGTIDVDASMISRTYTLDASGYHIKDVPAGYDSVFGVAINTRGDVLGEAYKFGAAGAVVLWRADGSAPVVIPETTDISSARDLDDDGTILVNSGSGSALWKDGVLRKLSPSPSGWAAGYAIRGGVVVGSRSWGGDQAARWSTPDSTVGLEGGGIALSINKAGLTAGLVPTPSGPVIYGNGAVWRGTTPGQVRGPSGYSVFKTQVAADDGTLAGFASNNPQDTAGVPVIWRLTP